MEEQRYYIAIDENGEAYIEHGLFDRARSTGQRAHKYLMKIGEGAKARYLYTQEEVRAYMQGGQKRNPNIKRPEDFEIRARRPDSTPNKMQQTKSSGIKRPEDFEIRARRPENVSSKTAKKTGQVVKDTVKKAVETVKDKAGVDERQRAEEAWSKVPKQLSSKDENGMKAFKEANKAQDEYRNTPLGRAEYVAEREKEIATGVDGSAKDVAEKAGNAVKSKYDRMKDEFRKKKDEAVDKVKDAAEKTGNKLKEVGAGVSNYINDAKEATGIPAKKRMKESGKELEKANEQWDKDYKTALSAQESRSNLEWEKDENGEWRRRKLTAEQQRNLNAAKETERRASDKLHESTEKVHEKTEANVNDMKAYRNSPMYDIDKMKDNLSKKASEISDVIKSKTENKNRSKTEYGEYKDDDPDFSDENYAKAKSIGNTDFSSFKRSDGTSVVLEEDMKWVLPKGVDANDPAIRKALSDFEDHVVSARKLGEDYSAEQWRDAVTEAIDKASEDALKKNK